MKPVAKRTKSEANMMNFDAKEEIFSLFKDDSDYLD
jgi:hypothetical protein